MSLFKLEFGFVNGEMGELGLELGPDGGVMGVHNNISKGVFEVG